MGKKETKRKNFSRRVMDQMLQPRVSIEMYTIVHKHTNNISEYIRGLIMKDLKIDEFGRKTE